MADTKGVTGLTLSPDAAALIRSEIEKAGGREVCFLAAVTEAGVVESPRAVARGNRAAVVAAARDAEEGGLMIHNHPSGELEPSDADLSVAVRLYEEGLGSAIVDNGAERLYVVIEPPPPRSVEPIPIDRLEALLADGGALSQIYPAYEDRPGQREMLRRVADRYNEGGVALVEAGTGTGKSLAYLLPAASWALQNNERTVISTNTINLQEQLDTKDLPLVRDLLGGELAWALVKGRGNYISIRRAMLARESAPQLFEEDRSKELDAILEWVASTDDGSLADLTFVPSSETWEEVKSDADICLRARCPHFQQCFYQEARRQAASAKLLIVNHHLLFSDLSVRRATQNFKASAVLPAYRHLILDEAHNLEDAATSHLGVEVSRVGLFRVLARIDRGGKGVLTAIQELLGGAATSGAASSGEGGSAQASELRLRVEERVRPALENARAALTNFMDSVEPLLPTEASGAVRIGTPELPEPIERVDVRERLDTLLAALTHLARDLSELRRRIELVSDLSEALEGRMLDLQGMERRVTDQIRALSMVLKPGEDESGAVRWMEWRGKAGHKHGNLVLAAAPIEPGALLRESLFEKTDTVVLSSATLATKKTFDFIRERVGLAQEDLDLADKQLEVTEDIVLSSFVFEEQTLLCVPTDLSEVNTPGDAFQVETAKVVAEMADITGGGLFVLFTSHRALQEVAAALRLRPDLRWPLFVHGEDSRARLVDSFVQSGSGVLLGTSSFWEGVDVPGRPLRGLIIQRLPFRVPTEPVTAARMEAIEAAGGNAFWDFTLPLAALRLKQGFGRLIRHRDDRGAVLLLDDRIVRKRYGRYLRDSLPEMPLVKGPWHDVVEALRRFYRQAEA
ncbi:MAG: DEAD/DEAH box helicase family protein [Gemmatimonadetes bacterium]|nr:DEAD/DEAH box helicase family protein [Gemmatimonadota bacterium]